MPMASPQDVARKWQRNLAAATDTIRRGVTETTKDPPRLAVAQQAAYLANVAAKVDKWADNLRATSQDAWRQATLTKGLPRIAAGATAAVPKVEKFLDKFLPHIEQGLQILRTQPRGDLQANIARAVTMIEHNARFRRRPGLV